MTADLANRSRPPTLDSLSLSLAARDLRLVRGWPRDEQHLLFEAIGPQGTVAGQWFASAARAAHVVSKTPGAEQVGTVVLQPKGADRRLPFLPQYLNLPGTVLIAHRPERRAVFSLTRGAGPRAQVMFTKVVRRDKVEGLARSARLAAALPLRTPDVLAVNEAQGSVTTAMLTGAPLHELLGQNDSIEACLAAGTALAQLHRVPPPHGLVRHGPDEERRTAGRWKHLARSHGLPLAFSDSAGPRAELSGIEVPVDQLTLIHRDFHDKQILIDSWGGAGVLDFDLMAVGDPMLDLANLLVHLELRALQGVVPDAAPLQSAVLNGYQPTPDQLRRVPQYERTTWDRLAGVYAFRSVSVPT